MIPASPTGYAHGSGDLLAEALRRELERVRVLASRDRGILAAILRHSPHGVIVADANGRLVLFNTAAERIWAGSASASRVADWSRYRAFHPDGRPYAGDDWSMARALRSGETVAAEEVEIERFDGTRGVILGSTAPIRRADGSIDGAITVFADVTQFKERERALLARERRAREEAEAAQRRMAFLSESSALLASSLDWQDTIASVARLAVPRVADCCAVSLAESFAGGPVALAHVDPRKVDLARALGRTTAADRDAAHGVPAVLRTGRPELYPELPPDGSAPAPLTFPRGLDVRSAMIVPMTARGRTLGAITLAAAESGRRYGPSDLEMAQHLARRAALAIDNARLYAEAQQAIRARDDVLAILAHDLRNPLHAIGLASSLISSPGAPPERLGAHAAAIARSARRMGRLVRDLLDSSRIESGRLPLERRPVGANALLATAASAIRGAAAEKGVEVEVAPGADALRVDCDPERAVQVLTNLLDNGLAATARGGRVVISAAEAGAQVRFTVSDSGCGIAPDHQPRIFDRYWTSRESRTGTGLGLAIAKGIVEAHGGRIWVESRAGHGATFHFTLPKA
jgi:PAS domain S-box-containing protein